MHILHSTENNPIDHIRQSCKIRELMFLHLHHLFLYDILNNVPPIKYNYNFHIYYLMSPSHFIKPHLSSETHWAYNVFATLNQRRRNVVCPIGTDNGIVTRTF